MDLGVMALIPGKDVRILRSDKQRNCSKYVMPRNAFSRLKEALPVNYSISFIIPHIFHLSKYILSKLSWFLMQNRIHKNGKFTEYTLRKLTGDPYRLLSY